MFKDRCKLKIYARQKYKHYHLNSFLNYFIHKKTFAFPKEEKKINNLAFGLDILLD